MGLHIRQIPFCHLQREFCLLSRTSNIFSLGPPDPYIMTTYYLVGIGTGHVLAQNKGARSCGVVLENKGEHDDEQKWTVEFGDEPDVIALKCVANGEYMNSPEREETGPVNIGDKQWWNISTAGLTPQVACRFSLVSSPEQFIYTSGNVLAKGKDLAVQRREWRASDSMVCFHRLALTR